MASAPARTVASGGSGRLVVIASNASATPLDLVTVVRMVPIRQSFLRRIDGSLDLGFGFTKASGVAQLNLNVETVVRRPASESSASLAANYTRQPDAPDSSRNSLKVGHARFLDHRWVLLTQGFVERNRDLGFDLRGTGAVSLGRQLVQTNRARFAVGGGLAVGRELPIDGPSVTNVDAMLALTSSFFTYDYPRPSAPCRWPCFPV